MQVIDSTTHIIRRGPRFLGMSRLMNGPRGRCMHPFYLTSKTTLPPSWAASSLLSPVVPCKPATSRILLLDEEEVSCLHAPLFATPSSVTLPSDAQSNTCSHEKDHDSTPIVPLPNRAITPSATAVYKVPGLELIPDTNKPSPL